MYITNPKQYLLIRRQGGISSKKKLSFKDDFNISFKSISGGYIKYPPFRPSAISIGFHKDKDYYINTNIIEDKDYIHTGNFSASIGGDKDFFALIIDYGKGGKLFFENISFFN